MLRWKEQTLEGCGFRFKNISAEIHVRIRAGCSNKVQWQKFGTCATECK
jgi:hypothetical protein